MPKKKTKEILNSDVWTVFLFSLPIGAAFYYGLYIFGGLITLSTISSLFFHLSGEKKYYLQDRILATTVILGNVIFCIAGGFRPLKYLLAVVIFSFLAIYYYNKGEINYTRDHALWHLFGALITLSCIMIYVI